MEINVKVPCVPGDEVYTVFEGIILKWKVSSVNVEIVMKDGVLMHLVIQDDATSGVLYYSFIIGNEPEDLYFTKEKAEEVISKNFELFKNISDKVGKRVHDLEAGINDDIRTP